MLRRSVLNLQFAICNLQSAICSLSAIFCACGALAAAEKPGVNSADWPTERVQMRDGATYEGYIESQDEFWINLVQIQRVKGRPMFVVIRPIDRTKIVSIVPLDEQQRAELRRRIDQFINRARIEAGRMEAVRLDQVTRDGTQYQRYGGKWFALESTVEEAFTRRIIVRVEQIFTAYRQILAPRVRPQRPLRVVVFGAGGPYRAYLARLGLQIQNPACFIPGENLVVAGSEATRFAAELAKVSAQNTQLQAELKKLEREMPRRLAHAAQEMRDDGVPQDKIAKVLVVRRRQFKEEIEAKRNELARAGRENDRLFQKVAGQMLQRLYHEAFHAYLENYVYPRAGHDVPVWLNEGLAQIFEAGLLEAETLRIDAPSRDALKALKADLAGQQPLRLEKVLAADQQAFLAGSQSNRLYAYAWGLAYYLTFEKHALGSPALDQYMAPPAKNASPVERFEKLVGAPLANFEPAWREYILNLR